MEHHELDTEVKKAQHNVELRRLELDDALNRLESRIVSGTERVQEFIGKVRRPMLKARDNAFHNLGLFVVCGFILGSWVGDTVENRRLSGSREPLPGELDEPVADDLLPSSIISTGT